MAVALGAADFGGTQHDGSMSEELATETAGHDARTGLFVAHRRSRKTLNVPKSQTLRPAESGARMEHPINSRRSRHSARARPTAATRTSPPRSEAEGSAAAAAPAALGGSRGSSRRAVAGTPKGAAGPARHVPGRAKERAATSRCRDGPDQRPPLNVHGASDGATPAGTFRFHSRLAGTLRPHQQEA